MFFFCCSVVCLGHEVLVHNLGVRLAIELNLTLLYEPLLGSAERGDHAELKGMSGALERIIGVGKGEAAVDGAVKSMTTTWLSRPCPDGAKKHVGGGAKWKDVLKRVKQEGSSAKARNNVVYRLCGDVGGVQLAGVATSGAKYAFGPTGSWWRSKMAQAGRSDPSAHATPLFTSPTAGASAPLRTIHIAVHIRRGDMVYRNFHDQLSPDAYYAHSMWHVLTLLDAAHSSTHGTAASSPLAVVFHVFSQPPPKRSWTGKPKVPLASGAAYVDELGCSADLHAQLAALRGDSGRSTSRTTRWEVRMHLDVDPVQSILHMAKADVLIASDSSFSLVAAVLSNGLVLSRGGWRRFAPAAREGMVQSMTVRDDGGFECEEAMRHWASVKRGPVSQTF